MCVCVCFFSLSLQFFALMLLVFGLEVAGTVLGYVYRDQVRRKILHQLVLYVS